MDSQSDAEMDSHSDEDEMDSHSDAKIANSIAETFPSWVIP
jgi:hypothetical protein